MEIVLPKAIEKRILQCFLRYDESREQRIRRRTYQIDPEPQQCILVGYLAGIQLHVLTVPIVESGANAEADVDEANGV